MAIVFKGSSFSVDVETIRLPNGREHQTETIRHQPSVVLVPMQDPGRLILVRRFRPSIGRELWECPAGGLNEGESPELGASRECEENIALVPERIERIAALFPIPGFCDEEVIFFRVSDLRKPAPDSPRRYDDRDIHAQVFTVAEAKTMVARGEIVDLKTAYALTLI